MPPVAAQQLHGAPESVQIAAHGAHVDGACCTGASRPARASPVG